ncbi:aldo/keto reductase family oxidoreductase [Rhodopila sp.]|uniref:aldo/keto reductase family oxidoreductase n=1 Tax=Rhodopila sp. TaxID=2480087 RepID=UPI003D0BD3C2
MAINDTKISREELGGQFTFPGTSMAVRRVGYGAMQLAGPGVFGPPRDRATALAVLREAVDRGVDHIDTSDFYGPHVVNQLIREALHPYPDDLVIVTKVGCIRGADGSWPPAYSREELTQQVHDNLRNLGLDQLHIVNLRVRDDMGPIEAPLSVLANFQQQGLIRHIGLSGVTSPQIEQGRAMVPIVCVQNHYNVAHRGDDAIIHDLSSQGIAYVPFFPLGGFDPVQSSTLNDAAARLGATPMQVAQAWLLHRSPNILLISGTSSIDHLRENIAVGEIELVPEVLAELDGIAEQTAPRKPAERKE